MLGLARQAARYVWTAAVIVLLLVALYLIRTTLFVFIVALLLAYLLSPLVDMLQRVLPIVRTRTAALIVAYLILTGAIVFAAIEFGNRIVDEANSLMNRLPEFINHAAAGPSPDAAGKQTVVGAVVSYAQAQIRQHANEVVGFLSRAGLRALSAAGDLVYIVIVPILSFFLLKDAGTMRETLLGLVTEGSSRRLAEDIARDIDVLLAQYMRALTVLSLFTLVFYSFYFSVTRVPYSLLLAAIAGILEFIPMVGPFTATVLVMAVAGFSGYPHWIWILVFLGLYRLFQDYVLSPRLMSEGMELHPLMVMFGVFAGGELGGVAGTFLSVPVLALLRILYLRLVTERRHSTKHSRVSS
jgi:predicted PurR-regulated permease PerM